MNNEDNPAFDHTAAEGVIEPLLNIDTVARIVGRSHWTLRQDIRAGKLKCVRIGRRIMFEPADIRRLIEEARRFQSEG
jgi:hypothetical protein